MGLTRRRVLRAAGLWAGAPALRHLGQGLLGLVAPTPLRAVPFVQSNSSVLGVQFVDVARPAGLVHKTIFGGEDKNIYLLETTGCGCAFFDYDNDGWMDVFVVNGTRLEGFPKGQEPTNHLYKNNRDGTFTGRHREGGVGPFRLGPRVLHW